MADKYSTFYKNENKKDKTAPIRQMLSYDPATGLFIWLINRPNAKKGTIAGHITNKGYVDIYVNGVRYWGHRLAWWFVFNEFPTKSIDHINQNPTDNRIDNLRQVTHKINCENKKIKANNNDVGWTGIRKYEDKFRVEIAAGDARYGFGLFNSLEEAKASYFTAKTILHKGFVPPPQ